MEKVNDILTRQQALEWCERHIRLINTSQRFTPREIDEFFAAYNSITGESKKTTGCGACIMNMKARLKTELKKEEDMQKYPLYLTKTGQPSLKPHGEPVGWIRAKTPALAKQQVDLMKKQKRENVSKG